MPLYDVPNKSVLKDSRKQRLVLYDFDRLKFTDMIKRQKEMPDV